MSLIWYATAGRKLDSQQIAVLHLGEMAPIGWFEGRDTQLCLRGGWVLT